MSTDELMGVASTEQLETRAQALMNEFWAHRDEMRALDPTLTADDRLLFEGWAIQKLANLQVIVLAITAALDKHGIPTTGVEEN